jgi:hypothetical protein
MFIYIFQFLLSTYASWNFLNVYQLCFLFTYANSFYSYIAEGAKKIINSPGIFENNKIMINRINRAHGNQTIKLTLRSSVLLAG